jgi:hypothetical protein
MNYEIKIKRANDGIKKFIVFIRYTKNNRTYTKRIKFGQYGASDYTIHKNKERQQRYINRHKDKEDWTKTGITTAGFWSRWILWNLPSLNRSIENTRKRFNLKIIL